MIRLDLFATLTALAPYAVVAMAAALAGFVLQNDLHRVQEGGLLVIGDPFAVSLYGGVLLLSVYLAASAAMAVAREREQGTVELLSYGPVSAFSYLLAKFTSHVLQYMFLVVLLLGSYLLLAVATGLHLRDRKSTRLNSSHGYISYAVFCLKKKKKKYIRTNVISMI